MTIERVRVERIKAKITSSWLRRTSSLFLRNSYIFPKVLNLLRILSGLLLKFLINLFSELTYLLFYTFFNFFINNCTNLFSNVCWQFLELDFVLILFVGSHFIIRFKYLKGQIKIKSLNILTYFHAEITCYTLFQSYIGH